MRGFNYLCKRFTDKPKRTRQMNQSDLILIILAVTVLLLALIVGLLLMMANRRRKMLRRRDEIVRRMERDIDNQIDLLRRQGIDVPEDNTSAPSTQTTNQQNDHTI